MRPRSDADSLSIRSTFNGVGSRRLVPTYTALHAHSMMPVKPYKPLRKLRAVKGKERIDPTDELDEIDDDNPVGDTGNAEFHREYRFLRTLMRE